MAVLIQLNGFISVNDNSGTGSSAFQKSLVGLNFTGTTSEIVQTATFGTSPTSITLPVSPIQFVFFHNLSNTATLTVTWTPTGGSSNVVEKIQPNGFIMFGNASTTDTSTGVSAISVTASGAGTTAEFILGG